MAATLWKSLQELRKEENNNKKYLDILAKNEDAIIEHLGGMDNIVKLCGAGPVSDNSPQSQPKSIQRQSTHKPVVLNPSNFSDHKTVVVVDVSKNYYYKLFPEKIAHFIYNDVVLNKKYNFTMVVLSLYFTLLLFASIFDLMGIGMMYNISIILCLSIGLVFAVTHLLSANKDIVALVSDTFDFWFKMYNLAVFTVCHFIILHRAGHYHSVDSLFHTIFISLVTTLIMVTIFLLDSLFLSSRIRMIMLVLFNIVWLYWMITTYFLVNDQDFNWNVLKAWDFRYTNVNWKNMYISSLSNIMLFTLKPIIAYVVKKVTKWYKKCRSQDSQPAKGDDDRDHDLDALAKKSVFPSFTIHHRRPNLNWHNVTKEEYYRSQIGTDNVMKIHSITASPVGSGIATPISFQD